MFANKTPWRYSSSKIEKNRIKHLLKLLICCGKFTQNSFSISRYFWILYWFERIDILFYSTTYHYTSPKKINLWMNRLNYQFPAQRNFLIIVIRLCVHSDESENHQFAISFSWQIILSQCWPLANIIFRHFPNRQLSGQK